MGKRRKKSSTKVSVAAPASVTPSKSSKEGNKRDSDVILEKISSAKKQKLEATIAAMKKKKEETSSSEDLTESSSDVEPVIPSRIQPVKNGSVGVSLEKKGKPTSSSSDSSDSDSDEDKPAKVAPQAKNVSAVPPKKKTQSSDSLSESDSEEDEDMQKSTAMFTSQAKNLLVPTQTEMLAMASKKKADSSDSSSESDSEEDEKVVVKTPVVSKQPAPSKSALGLTTLKKQESSKSSSESDSSEDEGVIKAPVPAASKVAPSKKKEESSDSSESDSDDVNQDIDVEMADAVSPKTNDKQAVTKSENRAPKTPATSQAQITGSKTLFVGNLSFSVERSDVEEFFKDAGEVVDVRFSSDENGRLRGFGHVEFATEDAAQKALELNNQDLLGRPVRLDIAYERGSNTPHSSKETNSYQKGDKSQGQTIFIQGFDKSLGVDQVKSSLEEHFGSCGEISRVSIPNDYQTGVVKGFAYIEFKDGENFSKALELNGSELGGYSLTVVVARPRPDSREGGGRSGGRRGRGRSGGRRGGRFGGGDKGR